MASVHFQNALLRPAILQIMRAAGYHNCSGAALDVTTDLAIRYLLLLATLTSRHAFSNHDDNATTIQDVRMALLEVGALHPQMSASEERAKGFVKVNGRDVPFEDMRGVEGFLNWAKGPSNYEIRRIAGLASGSRDAVEVAVLDEREDYVTALKKKYNKTGEDSRYQGTLLGKEADQHTVTIVGGPATSIQEWAEQLRSRTASPQLSAPASATTSSSPLTPIEDSFDDDRSTLE